MLSFQVPVLGSTVGFLSPFLDSLPQLFLKCLPYAFAFGLFPFNPLSYQSLLFRFWLLGLCFFLSSFFLPPPHSGFLSAPFRSRFFGFPHSFRPSFPCLLSWFFVLGFLFVSFRPSRFRSHSCSTGASLLLSPSGFPLSIRFLSSASLPVLTTQPLFLPFLFLPVSPSQRVFFGAASLPFSFLASPLPFHLVSHVSLSFPRTRLPVCFLSSLPASLPQLFHRCFPYAFAFGLFPLFRFLSSTSVRF